MNPDRKVRVVQETSCGIRTTVDAICQHVTAFHSRFHASARLLGHGPTIRRSLPVRCVHFLGTLYRKGSRQEWNIWYMVKARVELPRGSLVSFQGACPIAARSWRKPDATHRYALAGSR